MKLPKPRLTVRRMMIAVAIVGLLLGALVAARAWMEDRRRRFDDLATWHFQQVSQYQTPYFGGGGPSELVREYEAKYGSKIAYHKRMNAKYVRAYRRPWLPVEPDPPEPE
jgi:hypothetical protein